MAAYNKGTLSPPLLCGNPYLFQNLRHELFIFRCFSKASEQDQTVRQNRYGQGLHIFRNRIVSAGNHGIGLYRPQKRQRASGAHAELYFTAAAGSRGYSLDIIQKGRMDINF